MLMNLTVDFCIGLIPGIGDLLDFVIKSHQKNALLFRRWYEDPRATQEAARKRIGLTIALLVLTGGGAVAGVVWVLNWFLAL